MSGARESLSLLRKLSDLLAADVKGLRIEGERLSASSEARFGAVAMEIDYDQANDALRVSVPVAVPPGAGKSFLLWCLAMNVSYWDVKTGVDEQGRLVVHSDLDLPAEDDLEELAREVVDRVESVLDFLDEDLVGWLLANDLGTPAQRQRWRTHVGRGGSTS